MKALTVQQPWAWAIVHGGKDVENRTQLWGYRGPLAIHAGKRLSERGCRRVPDLLPDEMLATYADQDLAYGAFIGMVELIDVHEDTGACCAYSKWAERSYVAHNGRTHRNLTHLVLERPRAFPTPIPARGRLGLWTPTSTDQELIDLQVLTSHPGGY